MPITNTDLIVDGTPQHDGRQRGRARYHFSEVDPKTGVGKVVEFDFNMRPPGTDFAALAAAKLPEIETQEKDAEVRRIYADVINGADYATERDAMLFNTVDELETFILKSTANKLRTLDNATIESDVHQVIAFETVFQSSASRIAGLLGNVPTGGPGSAGEFKNSVNALMIGVDGYEPTLPTYPEVE